MTTGTQDLTERGQRRRLVEGVFLGLCAALTWAIYNIGVDIGRADGFSSADLAILRYAGAGTILLPLLLRRTGRLAAEMTVWRMLLLSVAIGPPFAFLINTGYGIAPLAHAVVISPGVTMIVANLLPVLFDGARLPRHRQVGIAVLIGGLIAIAMDQPPSKDPDVATLVGDLCFVGSGTLWGLFTYLVGRWRIPAIEAIGTISVLTTLVCLPVYLLAFTPASASMAQWGEQLFYQGVLGGCIAIIVYAASIARLGPGLAGLFPAIVPPLAVLIAIPYAGIWPNGIQLLGVGIAALGLILSLDGFAALVRRLRYGRDRWKALS
ncbi:DMT family transporter [Stappia sp. ES.058]|uniref:DMT family transporter n=1 Tax=Stappia sp. ES.058 TaxID=1881061 RepID=UPI00087BB018|nr:DMT family transporter [Stappia sp. ES.058]SDU32089.1 Permease of the drug/metabolite transporter (DMT) superfamily [Stappia sp. ES.058]